MTEMKETGTPKRYELRFIDSGREVRLLQISGGGRLLLSDGKRHYWTKSPVAEWHVFEASDDETRSCGDRAEAEAVCARLTRR